MFYQYRKLLFENYNRARDFFCQNPHMLIDIEHYITQIINNTITEKIEELVFDYNEASYLNAFWAEYPPDNRGRAPVGDQIPWIEVGEHAIGHKLNRLIAAKYDIREIGLPSGADNRFVLISDEIETITRGFTDRAFVFLDIKSVGPRDNFDHTVISPYQVSGDGVWEDPSENMVNSTMLARGRSVSHVFHPAIAPIYSMTDGSVAPTVHLFVKPIDRMLNLSKDRNAGQPLDEIKNICVPNGLLLAVNPNFLDDNPGLFFPGKDDKGKDPRKIRVRVSFEILRRIAPWRVFTFECTYR